MHPHGKQSPEVQNQRGGLQKHLLPVQNVINQFTRLAQDPRVSLLGNVTVGRDISLAALRRYYDGVRYLKMFAADALREGQRLAARDIASGSMCMSRLSWHMEQRATET